MSPAERALREQAEAMGLPVFPSEPDPIRCQEPTDDQVETLRKSRLLIKYWSDQT